MYDNIYYIGEPFMDHEDNSMDLLADLGYSRSDAAYILSEDYE